MLSASRRLQTVHMAPFTQYGNGRMESAHLQGGHHILVELIQYLGL